MSLADAYPHLVPDEEGLEKARDRIYHAYRDYVSHVSPEKMAISLETATYILWASDKLNARTAMDFGSGFTSYVLRLAGCDTVSIDDSPEWQHWTRQFLKRYSLDDNGVILFDEFRPRPVDLVVYDFSSGQMRHDHFLTAVGQVAKGGIAILDDAMHELHQKEMNRTCAHYRYDLFSIPWTQDWYGRYAALVVRP